MAMIRITAGPFVFMARMEEAAPQTCEVFRRLFPFTTGPSACAGAARGSGSLSATSG